MAILITLFPVVKRQTISASLFQSVQRRCKRQLSETEKVTEPPEHEIRVAVAGVGSAVSGMLQAAELYKRGSGTGLLHRVLGPFSPSDISLVAAFDVDERKVGRPVREALQAVPGALPIFTPIKQNLKVEPGLSKNEPASGSPSTKAVSYDSFVSTLEKARPDVLLNAITGGLDSAGEAYAQAALDCGCAFVNATPTPIATSTELEANFRDRRLPLLGDDLLSQIGGTLFHSMVLSVLSSRGVKITQTYQLDVGGGRENEVTVEDDELRLRKRAIKTLTVASVIPYKIKAATGTTEYVDFMGNSRDSRFEIMGESVLGAPIEVEVTLRSVDGANAAGPLLDAVRVAKLCLSKRIGGAIEEVNPYLFKLVRSPVDPVSAERMFNDFIKRVS